MEEKANSSPKFGSVTGNFMMTLAKAFVSTTIIIFLFWWFGASLAPQGGTEAIILTGSMTPLYPTGSVIFTAPVNARSIVKGDVVALMIGFVVIVHRVVEVENTNQGVVFTTKGDFNPEVDSWHKIENGNVQKVVFCINPLLLGIILTSGFCLWER